MPVIHAIPVTDGMAKAEISARINSGWVLAGRQAVNLKAQGIVTPGEAMTSATGVVDVDVWILVEQMMPTNQLVKALYDMFKQKMGDVSTLNALSTALLGLNIEDLVGRMDMVSSAEQAESSENKE